MVALCLGSLVNSEIKRQQNLLFLFMEEKEIGERQTDNLFTHEISTILQKSFYKKAVIIHIYQFYKNRD